MVTQLQGPVVNLVATGPGEHTMRLAVSPENLGPVTVRATIGVDGSVRIELSAPTDTGREALRQALTDLRRDLAGQGMPSASLHLTDDTPRGQDRRSNGNQPDQQPTETSHENPEGFREHANQAGLHQEGTTDAR